MTSKCLNAQNLFKVGKSSDPKQRLSSLNTSIIADEQQMFLCYKHECYDSLHFEKVLHTILDRYRYVGNREFFQFNLDGLIATIEDLCTFNLEFYERFDERKLMPMVCKEAEPLSIDEKPSVCENKITNYFSSS
jgi:hypothetical protein